MNEEINLEKIERKMQGHEVSPPRVEKKLATITTEVALSEVPVTTVSGLPLTIQHKPKQRLLFYHRMCKEKRIQPTYY